MSKTSLLKQKLKEDRKKFKHRKIEELSMQDEIEELEMRIKSNERDLYGIFKGTNNAVKYKISIMKEKLNQLKEKQLNEENKNEKKL